jgi:ribosome recycling factor
MSEDEERRALEEVQKVTDQHVSTIDDLQKKKDADLLGK